MLVCQPTIADSNADLSVDLRRQVREQIGLAAPSRDSRFMTRATATCVVPAPFRAHGFFGAGGAVLAIARQLHVSCANDVVRNPPLTPTSARVRIDSAGDPGNDP